MESIINWADKALFTSAKVFVILWIGFGLNAFVQWNNSRVLVAHADSLPVSLVPIEMKGKSIEQLKDELIAELAKAENLNGLPAYLDQNPHGTLSKKDALSYGCLAYKLSTVERHYKAINGQSLNDLDAALLALDCTKAKALAREVIFGSPNAIGEWMAATDKMKMKVSVIREMMK